MTSSKRNVRLLAAAACVIAFALAAAATAAYIGKSARSAPMPRTVLLVDGSGSLFNAVDSAGIRGRTVVVISRHFHYNRAPVYGVGGEEFPDRPVDVHAEYRRGVGHSTWLWVAVHEGIFRRVAYVVSPEALAARRANALPVEVLGSTPDTLRLHEFGTPLTVSTRPPDAGSEPPVVIVDASHFDDASPAPLDGMLASDALAGADMVVFSLSTDSPDVSTHARDALRAAYERHAGGGAR